MKKFPILAWIITLAALIPALQSCLDTDNDDYLVTCPEGTQLALGTVIVPDANAPREFYFALDKGITLFPGDTTTLNNYKVTDGQRAFIGYLPKTEPVEGYDMSAIIYSIEDILTKDIIPLTEETSDSIGNDGINITTCLINDDYVTLEYQYLGSMDPNKKHMLNLVENQTTGKDPDEGYICLEFRHNAFNDTPLNPVNGIVSFKLRNIREQMKDKKGIKIRVQTVYDGLQEYKTDF